MVNNTQIMSISVPKLLVEFIESIDLSPSAIFQEAVMEKKQIWERYNTENARLLSNIKAKDDLLTEIITFMELKGISYDEFHRWKGEKNRKKD